MSREKSTFEKMGGTYQWLGDNLFPKLIISESETRSIEKYGMMRKTYLKEHRSGWYQSMLLTGKLDSYLADMEEQAQERFDTIASQMMKTENVTEKLKAERSLAWVQAVNSIHNRVDKIMLSELIYS